MKRFITTLLLVTFYSFSLTQTTYAIFCSNCSQFLTQIPQYATELITKGATFATQINTLAVSYKLTILDPIANGLITVSLLKQQANTLNLVTGALGGGSALLQADPEKWIKNQGLNVVQVSLSDLNQQKGVYGNSLFSSVVSSFKASNNPLQTTLANLGGSSIPSTVQSNLCSDATLTKTATNDVNQNGTYGTDSTSQAFKQAAITKRKQEIYSSLCTGNPLTDSQLATRLQQVNSQRPDIGGWDAWLSLTGGDNAYNKGVQATLAISKAVDEKTAAAKDDLNRGGGIVSPRQCASGQQVQNAPNGDPVLNISDALCRGFSLTNTGSAVNAAFQTSLNSGFARLTASFGSGILGTLSALLSARNTIGMLSNAFGTATGGSAGGTNTTTTTSSNTTPTADLTGNADAKSTITTPALARLTSYSSSLTKLEQADNNLLSEISIAEGMADEIKGCFQKLRSDFTLDDGDSRVSAGQTYYQARINSINSYRSTVAEDQNIIAAARTAVADLKTLLANSNSSQEIQDAYQSFEDKVSSGTYPTDTAGDARQGDYITLQGENQVATIEGGTVYNLRGQCTQTRQQLTPIQGF
jgi:hypothetical protein